MLSRRKQALLALILGLALACTAQWHHKHRPVHYPADWPLAYLTAPRFSSAGAVKSWSEAAGMTECEFVDWQVCRNGVPDNSRRCWRVGFNTESSFQEVERHIEESIRGSNWSATRLGSLNHYYSEDRRWQLIFVEDQAGILLTDSKTCLGPGYIPGYPWQLTIFEYRNPLDNKWTAQALPLD